MNRLPALPLGEPRVLEIQVPAIALQENRLHNVLTQTNIIQSVMTLPPAGTDQTPTIVHLLILVRVDHQLIEKKLSNSSRANHTPATH